jgi:hypothetical protein
MFQHRGGVAQLEVELRVWLETPHGRFAVFYAKRQRRREAGMDLGEIVREIEAPAPATNAPWTNEPFWHARRGDVWEGGGT